MKSNLNGPYRQTGRGLVVHGGAVLLMERWRGSEHYFSIPGGGVESGETPPVAAARELLEETAVQARVDKLVYQAYMPDGVLHNIYLCTYLAGEPLLPPDSPEARQASPSNRYCPRWVAFADLPRTPFAYWLPIGRRLHDDLVNGFGRGTIYYDYSALK